MNNEVMKFLKKHLKGHHGYFKTIEKYKNNNTWYYFIEVNNCKGYLKVEKDKQVYSIKKEVYDLYKGERYV